MTVSELKKIDGTIERYKARLVAKALTNNREWSLSTSPCQNQTC